MTIKVGINGYGRIGRNIVRAIHESGRTGEFDVVALNDLGDAATNAHLTRRDTAHGTFPGTVEVDGNDIVVNGDRIRVFAERDPAKLPWAELGVDVVFECTGLFRTRETAGKHLDGGAGVQLQIHAAQFDLAREVAQGFVVFVFARHFFGDVER